MAVSSATWTGNSSTTTAIGAAFRLSHVTIHYDASVSNDATISVNALDGANYDTVLITFDNSAGETDNYQEFSDGAIFEVGDEIVVAVNAGGDNAYCRIVYELL